MNFAKKNSYFLENVMQCRARVGYKLGNRFEGGRPKSEMPISYEV